MTAYTLAKQDRLVQALHAEQGFISAAFTHGRGLVGMAFLWVYTFRLRKYAKTARDLHILLMGCFEHRPQIITERAEYFAHIQNILEQRLTHLEGHVRTAEEKNIPAFFVDALIAFEDALSDALFCLQSAKDTEFQDLLCQLQQKAA